MDQEIEARIRSIEERLAKLEAEATASPAASRLQGLESRLVEKSAATRTQDMIIISLKLNGKQTKEEIRKALQEWGKVYGNWFDGGNFNGRLVKKNIVKRDAKNEGSEDTFSLTKRGEFLATELIQKVMGIA